MIKKADIYIIIFIFLIVSAVFFISFFGGSVESGNALNIYIDGKKEYSFQFPLEEKKEIDIENEYGFNKIIADKNRVYITESDCKGHDCVKTGGIDKNGELIICVPHRLVVRIENTGTEGLDAVTY